MMTYYGGVACQMHVSESRVVFQILTSTS